MDFKGGYYERVFEASRREVELRGMNCIASCAENDDAGGLLNIFRGAGVFSAGGRCRGGVDAAKLEQWMTGSMLHIA